MSTCLDSFGILCLCVLRGAGLQRVVQMVDSLSGGIADSQQSVLSHTASVEGLALSIPCTDSQPFHTNEMGINWERNEIETHTSKHLRVGLAHVQAQRAA